MTTTPATTTRFLQTDRADVQPLTKGGATKFSAKAGQSYRVVMPTGKTGADAYAQADDVIATRKGQALHLSYPDKTEAVFDNFFEACAQDQCKVELPGDDRGLYTLTGGSPQGVAAGADGQVLYAHGGDQSVVNLLRAQGVSYDGGQLAGLETAAGHSTYIPPGSAAGALPWVLGGLLGAAGIAAAAGGGGGGGDNHQADGGRDPNGNGNGNGGGGNNGGDTGGGDTGGGGQPQTSTLVGQVTGPVIAGHGLSATAYGADGTALASTAVSADGSFSLNIDPAYTGPVLVRVSDSSAGPDYRDAATNTDVDLGSDLRAATVVTGPSTHHVNVNTLTEVAVRDLGLAGGDGGSSATTLGTVDAAAVTAANQQLAHAVGLNQDLVSGAAPVAVITAAGATDGDANDYGRLLAAISGAETGSTTNDVLSSLVHAAGPDGLSAAAIAVLVGGAANVPASAATLVDQISDLTQAASGAHAVTIDDVGDNIINAAESGAGVAVTGTATANTSVDVSWGGHTETVTTDANGLWTANFPSGQIPADGAWTIVATEGGASATRGVVVDTTGPVAPAAPVDYRDDFGSDTGNQMTAVVTDDATPGINVGVGLPNTPVLFIDGVRVNSVYDPVAGTLTPDTALADGQHAFTYASTDAAGNDGAQSPPLYIVTVADALALTPTPAVIPGTTSGNDSLASNGGPSILIGGDGNDTLTSAGDVSAMYGGSGDDLFVINQAMVDAMDTAKPEFDPLARIAGGGGTDTVSILDTSMTLHLPSILQTAGFGNGEGAARFSSIEVVDLTGAGGAGNTLLLALEDLELVTDDVAGSHTLRVLGDASSSVDIVGYDIPTSVTGGWSTTGTVTEGAISYDVWENGNSRLLIQDTINVY